MRVLTVVVYKVSAFRIRCVPEGMRPFRCLLASYLRFGVGQPLLCHRPPLPPYQPSTLGNY